MAVGEDSKGLDLHTDTGAPRDAAPSPAALRTMLGRNLRTLASRAPSVSALCRDLGINRTQFNRYLSGESFPRPDLLYRICRYFRVDARILLEPLEQIEGPRPGPMAHPEVRAFLDPDAGRVAQEAFPSGFFRFVRRSFLDETQFVQGLVRVYRRDGLCFVRGFEARDAMRAQGLPETPLTREFRGSVMAQEDGVAILASRRGTATASFNYLARVPSFENNNWVGYTVRTLRENVAGRRAERLVYEHLGDDRARIFAAARGAGFVSEADLLPFHRRLLTPEMPFS